MKCFNYSLGESRYLIVVCMLITLGLAEDFLVDYIQVNIGSLQLNANHNILQIVEVCQEYEKEPR